MAVKISEELRQQIRAAKEANPSLSGRQLGQMFGVHKGTANEIVQDLQVLFLPKSPENGLSSGPYGFPVPSAASESSEIKGDDWTISIPKTPICTEQELIDHCKIDLTVWEIEKIHFNKWDMGFKDKDGEAGSIPLFQVKAFCKRKRHVVDAKVEIQALIDEAKQFMPIPTPVVYTTQDSDNALELLIPDLHLAKLAYSKETGFQNYDVELAVETYRRAIDSQIQHNSHYNIAKIILGVGNDVLQADNIQGTTYGGTKVDVDSRYRKSYVTARKMYSETIEKLRLVAPVDVKVVPGNHDTLTSFTLGHALECKFENYSDVTVDNQPTLHKVVEWGDVLLALLHGDKGKRTKYGTWLATTYPQAFGRTRFWEIHMGHKHKLDMDEEYGIVTRTFRALCPPDEWHASNLFTGNLRSAEGLMWNKHKGLINQSYYTELD